jgi:hypothetical protein
MEQYECTQIVTCGIGSKMIASWLNADDLTEKIGRYADAMPAWAVREAVLRTE